MKIKWKHVTIFSNIFDDVTNFSNKQKQEVKCAETAVTISSNKRK